MTRSQKALLTAAGLFILLLAGYRYSLYQQVSQLPYLNSPETVTPFLKLVTYLMMIIGIIPTSLILIATSFFCHTEYPSGTVLTICSGQLFSFSDTNGFIAYSIACLLTVAGGWYVWHVLFRKLHTRI